MALCEDWATDADLCSPCDDYSLSSALMDDYLTIASETLYVLSDSQFPGSCTVTIRPCQAHVSSAWPSTPTVNFRGGTAYNVGGCGCRSHDTCSCPSISEYILPHDDVNSITQVRVDGVILATSDYRLDPPNRLVNLTDEPWPCCQDLSLPNTADGTWSVSYSYGLDPPALGVKAAAVLACELYMLCQPEDTQTACRLPSNWTSIARLGVTVARLVEETFNPRSRRPIRFGIAEIDLFLSTYAPHGHVSYMVSPDDPPSARITG